MTMTEFPGGSFPRLRDHADFVNESGLRLILWRLFKANTAFSCDSSEQPY